MLEVRDLRIVFNGKRPVEAVKGISFFLNKGETLGFLGQTGCGKTVTARAVMRLLMDAEVLGKIRIAGRDIYAMKQEELRNIRGRKIAMIPEAYRMSHRLQSERACYKSYLF